MNEVRFIKNNGERWKELETLLSDRSGANPDQLSRLYIELTDDLAFAKTFFPKSKTTKYLNQLTLKAHSKVFKRRKTRSNRLLRFFLTDYPLTIYKNRKNLFYALLIFLVSVFVGVISLQHDQGYVRLVLGDEYVNMTLENIEKGEPLAIYDRSGEWEMFFRIMWNNIRVSFMAYSMGILAGFGTFYLLFYNGLMLGTFQYFFITKGLGLASALGVWLHGTIEITSIIIAGGAGLAVGRSLLFPGNLPRSTSLRKGGVEGAKIVGGLIPFFIMAAFIESFITRHSQESQLMDAILIGLSILLIISYFIIYPYFLTHKINKHGNKQNGLV